jgi:hypothetical protein
MARLGYRQDWVEDHSLSRILDAINDGTSPVVTGGVQFTDHDCDQYFFLLTDAFKRPSVITRSDLHGIVYRSCIDIRRVNKLIRPDDLLQKVSRYVHELLQQKPVRYSMWTSLRLKEMASNRGFRLTVREVSIEGRAHLPKRMRIDDYFISGIGDIRPNDLPFYGYLVARCEARTEAEAAVKIFEACDTFNAAINLRWRFTDLLRQRKPEAVLWLGPYQFFFRRSKFLGKEHIWYNGTFNREHWDRFPKDAKMFAQRLPGVRRSLAALETHPFGELLRRCMTLISEGQASDDLSFRLMRYWSALETLFGDKTTVGKASKKLAERATFAEVDPALSVLKLQRLSDLRNRYVHEGTTEGDDTHLMEYLRELLCQHIFYLLHSGQDFSKHAEYLAMADLPGNATDLSARKLAIQRRENIMSSGRHRGA